MHDVGAVCTNTIYTAAAQCAYYKLRNIYTYNQAVVTFQVTHMGVAKLLINYWIRDDCVISDYQGLLDDRLQLMHGTRLLLAKTYNMYCIGFAPCINRRHYSSCHTSLTSTPRRTLWRVWCVRAQIKSLHVSWVLVRHGFIPCIGGVVGSTRFLCIHMLINY